ncbi:hypothetical protein FB567DRAFT_516371 [Paraphoma chrysanthemicola]|uniref:Uncharacterized protein n=1 Tax=Paraphoma chrysanthemicola TaxID=798071 RepID=A0A8K0RFY5_9PLEO|nr:hypothetical protein FB567DRAFT_516371 [Paraphoma chrysanthemicola]
METITNAASAAATTVSSLIYGQPAKNTETTSTITDNNETAGKEPVSGEQGKGTVTEPFDKGNAENPIDTASKPTGSTSSNADDFLPLNPTVGKPTTTEPSTATKSPTSGEPTIPIVPLNPDVATMGGGKTNELASAESGATEKTGTTDKVYKETPLDDIKLAGAPGAGPTAPEYTPATPETNVTSATSEKPTTSASDKPTEHSATETAKDSTSSSTPKDASSSKKDGVNSEIDAILNKTPKAEHSVDDAEAESPHAKMTGKTVRQTDASKPGEGGEPKSLVAETSGHKSDSRKSSEQASSPTGGDEKSSKKMSALKDKLKDKLHIGSKDK